MFFTRSSHCLMKVFCYYENCLKQASVLFQCVILLNFSFVQVASKPWKASVTTGSPVAQPVKTRSSSLTRAVPQSNGGGGGVVTPDSPRSDIVIRSRQPSGGPQPSYQVHSPLSLLVSYLIRILEILCWCVCVSLVCIFHEAAPVTDGQFRQKRKRLHRSFLSVIQFKLVLMY